MLWQVSVMIEAGGKLVRSKAIPMDRFCLHRIRAELESFLPVIENVLEGSPRGTPAGILFTIDVMPPMPTALTR
jgi:hypothetical protein